MKSPLDELKSERLGGATSCAAKALDCFEALAEDWSEASARKLASEILRNKPEMVPLLRIADRCLQAKDGEELQQCVKDLRAQLEGATEAIAAAAVALAGEGCTIATTSQSSTVHAALRRAGQEKRVGVLLSEGRPSYEGRQLAEKLSREGIPVTFATDAALLTRLQQAHAVWIGADAVGKDFFANKVGTLALCLGAKHYGLPVYVLASIFKFLPEDQPYRSSSDHPPDEVWKKAPPDTIVINPYFEQIPRTLITEVITEQKPSQELMEPLRAITQIVF